MEPNEHYRPLHFDPDHHVDWQAPDRHEHLTTPYPEPRPASHQDPKVYISDPDRKLGLMWTIFVTCVLATVVWLFVFFPLAVPFAVVGWIAWSVIADTRKARRLRDSNH